MELRRSGLKMTERKEASKRRFLHKRKAPECTCKLEKPKDTMIDVSLKFASLSVIVVGFISSLFHYLFAIYAEQFYGVPSLYFYDRKLDFGLVIIYLLIPAFVWFIPVFVKRVSKESKFNLFERILLAFAVALLVRIESLHFSNYFSKDLMILFTIIGEEISCINLARVTKIIQDINYDFLSLVLSVFSFFGYCLLFSLINAKEQQDGSKSTNNGKLLKITSGVSYVITGVLVVMMAVVLITNVTPWDLENQKSYEFISGKESGYRIVVGHYQDSVILMRGNTKECTEYGSQLIIIKGDYRIEPLGERQIKYRQFDKVDIN